MLRKHFLPRNVIDFFYIAFLVVIVPIAYWFVIFKVLPVVHPNISLGYISHVLLATFLLVNATSNYVYLVLTDTSVKKAVNPAMADPKRGCFVVFVIFSYLQGHGTTLSVIVYWAEITIVSLADAVLVKKIIDTFNFFRLFFLRLCLHAVPQRFFNSANLWAGSFETSFQCCVPHSGGFYNTFYL